MQRRPNKETKQKKGASNLKIIILLILDFIFGLIVGLGTLLFYFRNEVNYINKLTNTNISETQPSGIYILSDYEGYNNYKNFKFSKHNQQDVTFKLLGNEYPRVFEVYPYSKEVYFNIEFSGNKLISREMIDTKNGTSLGNNTSNINWSEYLSGRFINVSEFESLFSFTEDDSILIYNDTKETCRFEIKDNEGHKRDEINILPGEYYITRTTTNGYNINKVK